MKKWVLEQFSLINRFRTFLIVFCILHKPSIRRPRLKNLSAGLLILLGFFQLGQAMRVLILKPSLPRPVSSVNSREIQASRSQLEIVPKEFFRGGDRSTRPRLQWKNSRETVEMSVAGDEVIREVIERYEPMSDEIERPAIEEGRQEPVEAAWHWPSSYTKMLICFLGIVGFGMGAASLLVKGDAPSLLRFFNCLALISLFVWELYNFIETPVYALGLQFFGAALLLASAAMLVRGCSLSYMFREDLE